MIKKKKKKTLRKKGQPLKSQPDITPGEGRFKDQPLENRPAQTQDWTAARGQHPSLMPEPLQAVHPPPGGSPRAGVVASHTEGGGDAVPRAGKGHLLAGMHGP